MDHRNITARMKIRFANWIGVLFAASVALFYAGGLPGAQAGSAITSATPSPGGTPSIVWMGGGHAGTDAGTITVSTSTDGTIWTAGKDGTVKHWKANGPLLRTLIFDTVGSGVDFSGLYAAFSKDGTTAALANVSGGISVWNLPSKSLLLVLPGEANPSLSASGELIAAGMGGSISVTQVSTNKLVATGGC